MNGAQAMVKCLEEEGVKVVFGYPGAAICPFFHSLSPILFVFYRSTFYMFFACSFNL